MHAMSLITYNNRVEAASVRTTWGSDGFRPLTQGR